MNDNYIISLAHQIMLLRSSFKSEGADYKFINSICEAYIRNVLCVASLSEV